jgi:hypothetical protein
MGCITYLYPIRERSPNNRELLSDCMRLVSHLPAWAPETLRRSTAPWQILQQESGFQSPLRMAIVVRPPDRATWAELAASAL